MYTTENTKKEVFEAPEAEITFFTEADVITVSLNFQKEGDGDIVSWGL